MPRITLTHFARFVDAKGAARTAIVKEAIRLPEYKVPIDYWHGLRSGFTTVLQEAGTKQDLDRILRDLNDDRKSDNYLANIDGFKKFWGRKELRFDGLPAARRWTSNGLEVKVAPDMRLYVGEKLYVVKFHFRGGPGDDRLSKTRLETMIHLMQQACPAPDATFAVIDVRKGEKRECRVPVSTETAIIGEAAAFMGILRDLQARESA